MVESFEKPHTAAAREPAVEAVAESVNVEKWEREEKPVGGRDLPGVEDCSRVGGEVIVREHRSLGCAGCAGCVDDARGSGVGEFSSRRFPRKRHRLAGQFLRGPAGGETNSGDGFGVGENVGDLAVAVEDVDRYENHTQLDA